MYYVKIHYDEIKEKGSVKFDPRWNSEGWLMQIFYGYYSPSYVLFLFFNSVIT